MNDDSRSTRPNVFESVHARLRAIITTWPFSNRRRGDKLPWLALRNLTRYWTMPIRRWREAMRRFAVLYQDLSISFPERKCR